MASQTTYSMGDRVEVRRWHTNVPPGTPDGMEGNYSSWPGPWLPGTVQGFDKRGHPWVGYRDEHGEQDWRHFGLDNVRLRSQES